MRRRASARSMMAAALVAVALLAALSACGRKNPPVLPDGQTDEFERQYPTSTEPQQGIFD